MKELTECLPYAPTGSNETTEQYNKHGHTKGNNDIMLHCEKVSALMNLQRRMHDGVRWYVEVSYFAERYKLYFIRFRLCLVIHRILVRIGTLNPVKNPVTLVDDRLKAVLPLSPLVWL